MAFDLTTQLAKFLRDLSSGVIGSSVTITQIKTGDGSASAPSYSFASDTGTGFYRRAASSVAFAAGGGGPYIGFGTTLQLESNVPLGWSSGAIGSASDVSLSRGAAGTLTLNSGTATPAGGSTSMRLVFGSTAGFGIYIGSGAPSVSAAQGSIYLRSDGSSTSTRLYVNTNGSTGWTNVTTAA